MKRPATDPARACNCAEYGGKYPDESHFAFCPAHNPTTCAVCQRALARALAKEPRK